VIFKFTRTHLVLDPLRIWRAVPASCAPRTIAVTVGALAWLGAGSASATERHFSYTYETGVLNPGAIELEPWTTLRHGRTGYYNRFDQRLEFEYGVVKGLQSALYWNFSSVGLDVEDPSTGAKRRATDSSFQGVSSEWKYQFSNPVADALGSAAYLEATLGPLKAELEGKALFDKRVGSWIGAFNLVGEYEWGFNAPGKTDGLLKLECGAAAAYLVTEEMSVGLEAVSVSQLPEAKDLQSSVVYAGPAFAAVRGSWWTVFTLLPQLAAFKGSSSGSRLDLTRHERLQARVIVGFHL
jgi:hypothetical protein